MPAISPDVQMVEAFVDIEIIGPPRGQALFFWALQATFKSQGRSLGAGHLGLQFYPAHPGNGALNWGGYHSEGSNQSGELPGSVLRLPSAPNNANTGDYSWVPSHSYRYRIYRSPERGWRGSVTDLQTGHETVVRDLWCEGDELADLMVWTEAFADCDDPPTEVRWSNFTAITHDGDQLLASSLRVNYQSVHDGGCITSNSLSAPGPDGTPCVLQQTGVPRTTTQGSTLELPADGAIRRGKR